MQEEQMPHKLTLSERNKLTVTGVTEVVSFDDASVLLQTCMGSLLVQGSELQLKNLSLEGGQVEVDGTIASMQYEENRAARSWLGRLLG